MCHMSSSRTLAVVLVDGEEGFVKKVVYGSDWIELHSFNPAYKTMRFTGADVQRISVVGLVKKVIKSFESQIAIATCNSSQKSNDL